MAVKTVIQVRRDTAANFTSANPTLAAGEPGFETDTGKVKFGDGSTAWTSLSYVVTDAKMVTSDITTNDVSTTKHGFAPKAPNDTAKFLRGDGTWAAPGGGGGGSSSVASDVIWDAKGDLAGGTGADAASKLAVGSNGQLLVADSAQTTGLKWSGVGHPELVFRYTVTGSDKSSIDTGVDTPDAGSNDFTNGDVLEIFIYVRTDEAVTRSSISFTVNNDTGANYDRVYQGTNNTTASHGNTLAQAAWLSLVPGNSATASKFGAGTLQIPNYTGTVGHKVGTYTGGTPESTAANSDILNIMFGWRNTAAITRFAVAPTTGGAKLKVGSQLLIYKRRNT